MSFSSAKHVGYPCLFYLFSAPKEGIQTLHTVSIPGPRVGRLSGTALLMRCTRLPYPQWAPAAVGCSSWERTFPLFNLWLLKPLFCEHNLLCQSSLSLVPKWKKKKKLSISTAFILPWMDFTASQRGLLGKWTCQGFSLGSLFSDTTIILHRSMDSGTGVYRPPDML